MKKTLLITNLLSIGIILFLLKDCGKNVKPKTITTTIYIPEIVDNFDTLTETQIKYITRAQDRKSDSLALEFLKDSIGQLNRYLDAIAVREYSQTFKDTFQEVNVYSKTRGELIAQSIDYKIYGRTIIHDTTILQSEKSCRGIYGAVGIRYGAEGLSAVAQGILTNNKNRVISVDISTRKQIGFTYGIKF
jgi:hypothetical protein